MRALLLTTGAVMALLTLLSMVWIVGGLIYATLTDSELLARAGSVGFLGIVLFGGSAAGCFSIANWMRKP